MKQKVPSLQFGSSNHRGRGFDATKKDWEQINRSRTWVVAHTTTDMDAMDVHRSTLTKALVTGSYCDVFEFRLIRVQVATVLSSIPPVVTSAQ